MRIAKIMNLMYFCITTTPFGNGTTAGETPLRGLTLPGLLPARPIIYQINRSVKTAHIAVSGFNMPLSQNMTTG